MFESVFGEGGMDVTGFFIVLAVSLICGVVYSFLVCRRSESSESFAVATALIPMAVAVVIALVNGNIGVGVAIAGAFGLVRFRSAPGTAREIAVIFIAMAAGLAFGTGYLAYGAIFILICGVLLIFADKFFASRKGRNKEKILQITIPESLDYTSVFDGIFTKYTSFAELQKVKSTNMGSMFRLTYKIILKTMDKEKEMIDAIRERNGNLEILCSRVDVSDRDL